ncbi:ABC transporter permease [Ureaplasma miroungigenitalium]|uniref:ABC transporter permease n=1 Tax=Ureaplasma miroungigenitalium TaxID=1042321 RepID=A0ABT3BM45_9BACT|nr:ABC transporter permease [Ureaplasma miroungigenitalium]MCV3728227.1 ABC transporter permease [Ureaplasma miroungigenitalium]
MKTNHAGVSEAFKKSYSYSSFLGHLIFKKVSTWCFVLILFLIMIPFTLIARFVATDLNQFLIISYVYIFINLLLTVIFSVIKALNLFKDLSRNGIDILVFSKSISRKNIILTKIGFLVFLGTIWSVATFICFIVFYLSNFTYQKEVNYWYVSGFFSVFFSFLIFGFMTSVIALKASSKVAIIAPIITFIPLAVIGSIASIVSTPTNNKMAEYLNLQKANYHSGTLGNVETFYLNNNKDEVFIIPKLENEKDTEFSERQKGFLNSVNDAAQKAPKPWQAISWLSVPYQFMDVFSIQDHDPIGLNVSLQPNNLKKYLYSNPLASQEYQYKIMPTKNHLQTYKVSDDSMIAKNIHENYLVPGLLRHYSVVSENNSGSLKDREIIYARMNADNINVEFKEDNNIFADPANLVGKISWSVVKNTLDSKVFNAKAEAFYNQYLKDLPTQKKATANALEIKQEIMTLISYITRYDNDKDQTFNALGTYLDKANKAAKVTIFDQIKKANQYLDQYQENIQEYSKNPEIVAAQKTLETAKNNAESNTNKDPNKLSNLIQANKNFAKAIKDTSELDAVKENVEFILENEIYNLVRVNELQKLMSKIKINETTEKEIYIQQMRILLALLHNKYSFANPALNDTLIYLAECLNNQVTIDELTDHINQIVNTLPANESTTNLKDELAKLNKDNRNTYINNVVELFNLWIDKNHEEHESVSFLNLQDDESISPLLNNDYLADLENQMQKKVYLITSLIYWIYFNKSDSDVLDYILKNDTPSLEYTPSQIQVNIDGYIYYIGGYESYLLTQHSKELPSGLRTIVHRYELSKSNNFLFQNVDEVYSIQRISKVVVKPAYSVIWISLATLLILGTYFGYVRRDYK